MDFGCPGEIQESVSSAITVLRLWKRVLEIKKMRLHSKPGAKSDPSKRGKFVTSGCYTTAEVLFSAATLYQLAMFLHFKHLGISGSSLFNTGTKSTERIISEIQGKTNEIQSLDSQPTFVDMLDKMTKVQFNINAKQRLAQAGAKVKQSSNRRQRSYAFSKHTSKQEGSYKYPSNYEAFLEEQKQAHYRGVRKGQRLFEKYMPTAAVDLLKRSGFWEIPYSYEHPSGMQLMEGTLPKEYNMLHKSYADIKNSLGEPDADVESELEHEVNDEREEREKEETEEGSESTEQQEDGDVNLEKEEKGAKHRWKITKVAGGTTTYIHIKKALKLVLPREYIARCRQKRHWASKYLPGKSPIDPTHDIVRFSNVALKSIIKGRKVFDIARVEAIRSTTDGSNLTSFKLRGDSSTRVRFSLYQRSSSDDSYSVHPVLGLTHWRSSTAILGAVELIPVGEESPGCYKLHDTSRKRLQELGYVCREEIESDAGPGTSATVVEDPPDNHLPEEFYEIEDIVERRLCNKTLAYEYRVRFKGYSAEDDMWLPASYFNRAIHFESLSKFGRKRKHKIDPDVERELPNRRRKLLQTKVSKALLQEKLSAGERVRQREKRNTRKKTRGKSSAPHYPQGKPKIPYYQGRQGCSKMKTEKTLRETRKRQCL